MEIRSLTDVLTNATQQFDGADHVSMGEILQVFHERGFGVVLFVLALPMALPVPVPPGINVMLALPLIILTMQQALGRHTIWMPKFIRNKHIQVKSLEQIFTKAAPFIKRMEWFVKPRFGIMTQGVFSHFIGLAGLIMALTVCIPLPLTNTVPSLGIACMAIGVVMRDGLAVIAGMIVGLLWISLLVILGETGLRLVLSALT